MERKEIASGVFFTEGPDQLVFENARIRLAVSKDAGQWTGFAVDGRELINHAAEPAVPFDFKVEDEWLVERRGARYMGCDVEESQGKATLIVHLGVGEVPYSPAQYRDMVPRSLIEDCPEVQDPPAHRISYDYHADWMLSLEADSTVLRTRIRVRRRQELRFAGTRVLQFDTFLHKLPGVIVGDEKGCIVDMPGPIIPTGIEKPRMPYREAKKRYLYHRPSPEFDLGVVAVSNPREEATLGAWIETTNSTYGCHLVGDGTSLSVLFNDEWPNLIYDTCDLLSHELVVRVGRGSVRESLKAYSAYLTRAVPPRTDVPAWVEDAVFMEVDPLYYGGFNGIKERLAWLAEIGFTAIYMLPINERGYNVADHYDFAENLGTESELKQMIAEAHRHGIKILFDLLVSIMRRDAKLVREHPEYFIRDEAGRLLPHIRWQNVSTDYAQPGFRKYLVDFALYCVRDLGADGFRVDAPTSKPPNWYPHSGHEPWETVMGAYGILTEANREIKKVNPEAVLLDECGGPLAYGSSDMGHNIGFLYQVVNKAVAGTGYTVTDYKNLLSDVQDVFQDGIMRVYYVRNHDTAWFYRFDGYSPEFFAYEAIHGVIRGIPLVFSGQFYRGKNLPTIERGGTNWDGPTEEDFDFYRKLFRVRRENRALIEGDCLFEEVDTDSKHVFSVLRILGDERILALVSGAAEPLTVKVRVDPGKLGLSKGKTAYHDVWNDENGTLAHISQFEMSLEPFGIRVLELG